MASQNNYTPLPSYADDVKTPLLIAHDHDGVVININQVEVAAPQEEETGCARRCNGGGGFFGRIRARCVARHLEKYGPPCENRRCVKTTRRRRAFHFVIFGLLSLFFIVHLFKGAYMLYTLPNRINCVPVTSETSTYDLPLSRKLFLDYSLTTGSTTIAHGDSNTTTVQLTFKDVTEDDNLLFCTGTFKRGVGVGVYTKDKHAKLPKVVETVITIPEGEGPMIKFGAKKASKCAGHVVRKVLKWKKGQEEEEEE